VYLVFQELEQTRNLVLGEIVTHGFRCTLLRVLEEARGFNSIGGLQFWDGILKLEEATGFLGKEVGR
jgi:hypothetical protein